MFVEKNEVKEVDLHLLCIFSFVWLKHKCIFNILFLCATSNLHNYLGLTDYRNTINIVFDKDVYEGRT